MYLSHVDSVNHHLEINFDLLASTVHCIFTGQQISGEKYCIIEYGPEENMCTPPLLYKSESRQNTSHSLTIDLPASGLSRSRSQSNRYCYIITASNGTWVVKVEGLFNAGACLFTLHAIQIILHV